MSPMRRETALGAWAGVFSLWKTPQRFLISRERKDEGGGCPDPHPTRLRVGGGSGVPPPIPWFLCGRERNCLLHKKMGQKMEMKYNFSEEIFCIATQTNVRTFRLNETVQGTFYPLASRGVKKKMRVKLFVLWTKVSHKTESTSRWIHQIWRIVLEFFWWFIFVNFSKHFI